MSATDAVNIADLALFCHLAGFSADEFNAALAEPQKWAREAKAYRALKDAGYSWRQIGEALTALEFYADPNELEATT